MCLSASFPALLYSTFRLKMWICLFYLPRCLFLIHPYLQINYWTFPFYLPSSLCSLSNPSFIFNSNCMYISFLCAILLSFSVSHPSLILRPSSICYPFSVLYLIPAYYILYNWTFLVLSAILSLFSISSLLNFQLHYWTFQFYLLSFSVLYLIPPRSSAL